MMVMREQGEGAGKNPQLRTGLSQNLGSRAMQRAARRGRRGKRQGRIGVIEKESNRALGLEGTSS